MPVFPWGLFAVLVGSLLPVSVFLRSAFQIIHDRHLGAAHTLNLYRFIKAILVLPFLIFIGPVGAYFLFGVPTDPLVIDRVTHFLGTTRGFLMIGSLLAGVLLIDIFGPRLNDQLSRVPISTVRRSPVQFRNDTAILAICFGLSVAAATLH